MNQNDSLIEKSKPSPLRRVLGILFYVILVCALPFVFFFLMNSINEARYRATTDRLRSDDPAVREDAIESLRGGGPECAHTLGRALRDDPDPAVREGAARALAEFDQATFDRGYDPVSDLRNAMKQDADATVREAARQALEKIEGR